MSNLAINDRYVPTGGTSAGGMGEIIECKDIHLQRPVVIKRLQDGAEARRLLDEQRALAELRSKHVVQLYDIVKLADGRAGLVLEFIDGENLEVGNYTADRKYLHTIWQIACGLQDIHAAGIVHRDIKPANIRIDKEKVVKILDFGLARLDDAAKTRSIIGTPVFMAPELWGEETISFNSAIDVYAFGVTAISLLTAKCAMELACQPPKPVSLAWIESLMSPLSKDVVQIIFSCLNPIPTKRPTMAQVQHILRQRLVEGRHKGLIVLDGKKHFIDKSNSIANVTALPLGRVTIRYDGIVFKVEAVDGYVLFNNTLANVGNNIPGCCVITFGNPTQRRKFVTFDVSAPEVMP